ncbi:HGL150Cp [Eremothecium sinecaudum]|uniref:HGL150Cp n=1 Tax=Eremothecium sinecaudum TaxID=45286 RepID=A0A0X8HVJ9_9SACH|nr:HGL150Cp [Eremothecium sinecaudum]AMD22190.1 HGL150Cp [Eremothecium sinecaudum]
MLATETVSGIHNSIISVDELQNYGVNASDLQKLKASGIFAVNTA